MDFYTQYQEMFLGLIEMELISYLFSNHYTLLMACLMPKTIIKLLELIKQTYNYKKFTPTP